MNEDIWEQLLVEDAEYPYHVQAEAPISSERVIIDRYVNNSLGDIEILSGVE